MKKPNSRKYLQADSLLNDQTAADSELEQEEKDTRC